MARQRKIQNGGAAGTSPSEEPEKSPEALPPPEVQEAPAAPVPRSFLCIVETASGEIVKRVDVTGMQERSVEKAIRGMLTNLDQARFHVAGETEGSAPASVTMDVLVELTRMLAACAGGSCVLFRMPPEVSPEVYAEIRKLCLAEPGAKLAAALPVYCFERDAATVLAEIVKGLGR